VFRLDETTALVQTVDFFTPVVDDPEAFGAIAAANALSDVYAMGGRPLTALSIAAFPETDFPVEWAAAIVRGGAVKLAEAGCALLGGHSVRDPEIKFGYAVTGLIDPRRILTNAGGRGGEILVLTKPLGTGLIATALKAGKAPGESVAAATESMARLNRAAAESGLRHGVTALTDITGFGLIGHASTVARQSKLTLEIRAADLPLLPRAVELAPGFQPAGLKANRRHFEPEVEYRVDPGHEMKALLYDPQTSGGLFLLVPEAEAAALLAELPEARAIGRARARGERPIVIV